LGDIVSEVGVATDPAQSSKVHQIHMPLHELGKCVFRLFIPVSAQKFAVVGHAVGIRQITTRITSTLTLGLRTPLGAGLEKAHTQNQRSERKDRCENDAADEAILASLSGAICRHNSVENRGR